MQEQPMDAPQSPRETALDLVELGHRLTEARVQAGLEVDDIAQRLHLPTATIQDLESGRVNRIGTPVYLKGFLRSYLRLLALPEGWADAALAQSGAAQAPAVRPAAGAVARRVSWLDRYKWAASYVVGTALALTAVHWLVSNTPQLGFPDATPVAAEKASIPGMPANPAEAPATLEGPPAPTSAGFEADDSGSLGAGSNEVPPILASLSPFRVALSSADDTPPLVLEFVQNSWVEVRDQSGSKLEYSVIRAGEQRAFSVGAPFTVSIGNVGGVRARVAGEGLDLAPYTKGNVARFSVSEDDGHWQAQAREPEASTRDDG